MVIWFSSVVEIPIKHSSLYDNFFCVYFQTLIDEIYRKKQEVHSLKVENASLTKRANEANLELFYVRVS